MRSSPPSGGPARSTGRGGPAVIVMAEIPGITPKVADVARRIASIGCTAVMPHLMGEPGRDVDPSGAGRLSSARYALESLVPSCISREFTVLARGRTSPVVRWLRVLGRHEHERCGGPGIGAIGMCFTGGFALAMATDERLLAPVLSQPSLPFTAIPGNRGSIDCSAGDLAIVRARCETEGLQVLGLRFKGDRLVTAERFAFLRRELGDAFVAIELDDDSARKGTALPPHSVLTEHLVDAPGEPTRSALDTVLAHFRTRLLEPAG
ncbi:MAG: dienelactone hydrolase family protein [Microthrixaceae bacterium]